MKLITFDGGRVGRLELEEGTVIELDVPSTREYFERGGQVSETGERLAYADVKLEAPIRPKKFFHTAGNFADHHKELTAVDWSHPVHKGIVFFQNVDAIIGTDDDIVYPPNGLTNEVDYELELAVVIGKAGKFFSPEEAGEYIAGYLIFNDITARDIQREEMKSGVFSLSKGIDTFCPIGPWIVTDLDVSDLEVRCEVGRSPDEMELRQLGRTKDMVFDVPTLVSYISHVMTLLPGDIILTGTPSGVSQIVSGETVTVSVQGIGELRNPVVSLD
jgi:2-keto-4-pentenoate hydratase/2-oxohepta-3-ene-1,7-dioic acid hydratase in catechol pathway